MCGNKYLMLYITLLNQCFESRLHRHLHVNMKMVKWKLFKAQISKDVNGKFRLKTIKMTDWLLMNDYKVLNGNVNKNEEDKK